MSDMKDPVIEDPKVLEDLRVGLEQSRNGQVVYLGDFSQYTDEDIKETN